MWDMFLPILLIVISSCFYNICSKSTPGDVNSFGTLMITYLTASAITFVLFLATAQAENVTFELSKINWTSFVLGLAIIGLESGYLLAYRAGWQINTAPLVANTCLAVALIVIGAVLFKESISLKQIIGIVVCLGGIVLINL